MLRLTLEIVPGGFKPATREIGVMEIVNVTRDFDIDDNLGKYVFNFTSETTHHEGTIDKWPRRLGAWKLVQACLQVIHGESPLKEHDNEDDRG
jgi:hypothetical protein